MRKLYLFSLLFSFQAFAYEMHMSCSGKDKTWLEVWSFTGGKKVEIHVNGNSYEASKDSFYDGRSLMVHDEKAHPWVYETYLERINGKWHINKYWLCLGYYFEEKGCVNDELRLEESTPLDCNESEY